MGTLAKRFKPNRPSTLFFKKASTTTTDTTMAEEQKKEVASEEFDPDFVDPEVEPLDAMLGDDDSESGSVSKVVGGTHKIVGSSRWTVSGSKGMSYHNKSAALLLVRDAYRSHGYHGCVKKISNEMRNEFGGYWHVVVGKDFDTRIYYTGKYIRMSYGNVKVCCYKD